MKKHKRISKRSTPLPLRVNFQMMWRWARYKAESCSQCGSPVGDGAQAELYMPLHPPRTYASEAEEFQAADDACNALADQQEQGHFTLYGMQLYCGACAEKAITEDVGAIAQAVISDLRSSNLEQFWVATFLQYEPGAYGRYQPCFLHGIEPASLQLIYHRACHSAQRGIIEKPRYELDRVRTTQITGKETRERRGSARNGRKPRTQGRAFPRLSSQALPLDERGRLHLQIEPSPLPCEECGRPGPNKEWRIVANTGVLCMRCLSAWIEEVNAHLGAREPVPTATYEPQPGDIYLQQLRPGQWNVHRYIEGVWEYQTMLTQGDAERFVALMHLVGETNEEPFGKRRYYRPLQA